MLFNRRVLQRLPKISGTRSHHPSPFDPQTTRGWKAAVKVSTFEKHTFREIQIHQSYQIMPMYFSSYPRRMKKCFQNSIEKFQQSSHINLKDTSETSFLVFCVSKRIDRFGGIISFQPCISEEIMHVVLFGFLKRKSEGDNTNQKMIMHFAF